MVVYKLGLAASLSLGRLISGWSLPWAHLVKTGNLVHSCAFVRQQKTVGDQGLHCNEKAVVFGAFEVLAVCLSGWLMLSCVCLNGCVYVCGRRPCAHEMCSSRLQEEAACSV